MREPVSEHDLEEIAAGYMKMAKAGRMNVFRLWDDLGRDAGDDIHDLEPRHRAIVERIFRENGHRRRGRQEGGSS